MNHASSDSTSDASGLRLVVCDDAEAMSQRAAELIIDEVRRRPSMLLCAATGSSPTRTYGMLGERRLEEPDLFSALTVVKLDEWGGLGGGDHGSCEAYLRAHLIDPLEIPDERYVALRGDAVDPAAECARVSGWLDVRGPIDLAVLGLGLNGHLGFNEPADEIEPSVHVAELSASSQAHPMVRHLEGGVRYGLTLGIGDILRAKRVVLLVSGAHKRAAMVKLLERRVSTQFPASLLWLHGDAVCLCDAAACP